MNLFFKLLTSLATWLALRAFINRPFLVSLSRSDVCVLRSSTPGLWMLEALGLMEEVAPHCYRITLAGIRALGLTVAERKASLRDADEEDGPLTVVVVAGGAS